MNFLIYLEETRKNFDPSKFYITRNGGFGNDSGRDNNFSCVAGKDIIVITSDHKVYPCNFLIFEEFCIGYWAENGIYIDKEFDHTEKECLALQKQLIKKKF